MSPNHFSGGFLLKSEPYNQPPFPTSAWLWYTAWNLCDLSFESGSVGTTKLELKSEFSDELY